MKYKPRIAKVLPAHIKRERDGDCPEHRAWIRQRPCVVQNPNCGGQMHAHHVRSAATAGTGMKPPDSACIPACAFHHQQLHNVGVKTFETAYNVSLSDMAANFASLSPALKRLKAKERA